MTDTLTDTSTGTLTGTLPDIRLIKGESDLINSGLQSVYRLWRSGAGEGQGPASIDLLAIPEMINDCVLSDVPDPDDPEAATVSFAGAELNAVEGHEMTGIPASALAHYPHAHRLICTAAREGKPLAMGPHGVDEKRFNFMTVEHICLPLSGDGKTVTGLIYALYNK